MSATTASPGPNVVVMGVAGCGKSSLARELAARLGRALVEGDDFHSAASRAKMAQGVALTDADRQPWLAALAERLDAARGAGEPVVLTCSALKQRYRERLRAGDPRDAIPRRVFGPEATFVVTDILAGGAIVAGGVTLYFTLAGGSSEKPKPAPAPGAAALHKSPSPFFAPQVKVGVGPGSVSLHGTF